ncbi:GDSL esterase/lipase EXL3-like [Vicia villosa]|uniref:GDSL esterase/lipase EXL3-like n=1 Tax=Vicia villosa TaxID=3911 RepID=UPI00273CE8C4|nr:GDSL esterase/lipase EXL3-like [Vicia villosa]
MTNSASSSYSGLTMSSCLTVPSSLTSSYSPSCFSAAPSSSSQISSPLSPCFFQKYKPINETVPALFVFGDSVVDTGNNNYINTIFKSNFLPYGKDFGAGNQPTGRFSNGLVLSDIIASKFGVKKLLPASLDPNLKLEDLLTDVSFASAASGYDPLTSKLASVIPLSDQLSTFKKYKNKIKEAVGEERMKMIISKSVYIICTGSNDIAYSYASTPLRQAHYDIPSYTHLLASIASNLLKELYDLGARRIGVVGMPNIGCVPAQRTIEGGIERGCADFENQAARIFNSKLVYQMDGLRNKFQDAKFVYLDIYNSLKDVVQNPAKYGFEISNRGCCGTGVIEGSMLCNRYTSNICFNPSNHVFWDSYHPTQNAYNVLCSMVLDHKIKDFF